MTLPLTILRCWRTPLTLHRAVHHRLRHVLHAAGFPRRTAHRAAHVALWGGGGSLLTCVLVVAAAPLLPSLGGGTAGVPVAVPEPSGVVVLAVGMAAVAWVRRWR